MNVYWTTKTGTRATETQTEYGVLKAVGTQNHRLYWLVTVQGLTIALVGVAAGIGLAWLASDQIMAAAPKFLVVLQPMSVLTTSVTGFLMGLLAAI